MDKVTSKHETFKKFYHLIQWKNVNDTTSEYLLLFKLNFNSDTFLSAFYKIIDKDTTASVKFDKHTGCYKVFSKYDIEFQRKN